MDAAWALWREYFGGITNGLNKKKAFVYRTPEKIIETKSKVDLTQFSDIYLDVVRFCGPPTGDYLKYLLGNKRRLDSRTISKFKICAVGDWKMVEQELKAKYSLERLREAGVFWPDSDRFLYRGQWILVPFFQGDKIIFLQGRRLDEGSPRYLHLKGLPLPLFNTNTLKDAPGNNVYICEGVFDAMIMEQWGYKAVAILGVNNFKPEYAELLKEIEVTVGMDNDAAGKQASFKIMDLLNATGRKTMVSLLHLPQGIKDLTDYYSYTLDKLRVKT